MTTEELLKPRYKVIADYPKSLYHVGDILNVGWRSEDCIYCDTEGPRWRHYPHLFKRLEWWQERDIKDMPEYLIINHQNKDVYKAIKHNVKATHGFGFINELGKTRSYCNYYPATIEQYNEYKSKS